MKVFRGGIEQGAGTQVPLLGVLNQIHELTRDMRELHRESLLELQKLRIHSEIITGENIKEEDI